MINNLNGHINELKTAEAFSRQSIQFDNLYEANPGIIYKRKRVREHLLTFLTPGNSILELNCGTGQDALFLAAIGCCVHATDISLGMLSVLKEKVSCSDTKNITFEQCSFTCLEELKNRGPFNAVFSNFGGLNCTNELQKVIKTLPPLVRTGGTVTMVIVSGFCLWEFLLLFRGRFGTAFRRFFSKHGRKANVEGKEFRCYYYTPRQVARWAVNDFTVCSVETLCCFVPPSYIENFGIKYPRLYKLLCKLEYQLRMQWPWNRLGDYFIVTLRKN